MNQANDWQSYGFVDSNAKKRYHDAAQLVRASNSVSENLLDGSTNFGDWYQLAFENRSDALDAPNAPAVFLVDMANHKVIDKMDFTSCMPLYQELLKQYQTKSERGKRRFAQQMASLTSVIAYGRQGYVLHAPGTHDPELTQQDDGSSLLEYYFDIGDGSYVEYRRCQVKITASDIVFEETK